MSLHQKTIVIIGLTFLGLMALLFTISRLIVLAGFNELEEKSTAQNVTRATNAIYDELVGLNSTAHDWASWDDTYTFVDDANEAYIENNLTASALLALRLNLMLFVDPSGQLVFGKAVDLLNQQEIPLPSELLARLSPGNTLLHHSDLNSSVSGIILLPEAPLLVVSRPILTSNDEGPSRGTLILGRYLDNREIQHLAELVHLSLHLDRFDDPHLPTHTQSARTALAAGAPVFVQPLDSQTIAGYSVLTDIEGEPILVLQVEAPREIYQQGQGSVAYLMGSLLAVGLVFGTTTLLLLEKQVLSRLTGLSQRVKQIGVSGDLTVRIPVTEQDELSHLAQTINSMLSSLEKSEQARKQAEVEISRRNRELVLLNQVIAAAAISSDAKTILETACRELALFFDLPVTTALLCDAQKNVVEVAVEYLAEEQPATAVKTILMNGSFPFQSLLTPGEPLFIADARSDPRLALLQEWITQQRIISLLILPLIVEGKVAGCLNLAAVKARDFLTDDIGLAKRVADQVAVTLARVRLVQAQQRLSAAIEQSAESIIITDTVGTIIYVNPAFERISGYSRAEALGQTPRLLKSGQLSESFYQHLWQTLSVGQVWRGRIINKKKDGSLYTVDKIITPVRDERGLIVNYVAVGDDVTGKLHLEDQLRQAQKMEGIGRLAGGIAHDFNNLLTVINGYSEILLHRHPDFSDPVRQGLEQIKQAGQRAATLTAQLLAFSRKQVLQPQILDLNHLVANMEKMLGRLIGEDINLKTVLASDLGQVKADPSQIEQVLVNLAVNARDAMPGGGMLTIETANVTLDLDYVHHHVEVTPGEYVMIAVTDTGIGMSAEVKAHLFEPFFTTKEVGKGTGLGLATCFGIVKQNRGHIWAYSEPGQGTTLKIYLPRLRAEIKPVSEETRPKNLPQGTEKILLVEDAPAVRELTARILRQHGYTVLEAADGASALRLIQAQPDIQFQLLLTDVVMPEMGGQVLVDRLMVERPGLKVLFMSGYTDTTLAKRGIGLPNLTFLQKPFTPAALLGKVREVLDAPLSKNGHTGH